jgi:hypothetical protein
MRLFPRQFFLLNAYYLDFVIEYLDIEATSDNEVDYPGKDLIGMPVIIADTTYADSCYLPGIIVIDLGNSDIEFITYAADNGFQDLPLTLERHVFRYAETYLAYTDIH